MLANVSYRTTTKWSDGIVRPNSPFSCCTEMMTAAAAMKAFETDNEIKSTKNPENEKINQILSQIIQKASYHNSIVCTVIVQ